MEIKDYFKFSRTVFDPEQKKAIVFGEGNCLVLAGPGSGKTTVLTNRVRYLNCCMNVPEKNILVLTFTRLAAEEMSERYCRLKGDSHTAVTFGTFHAVFYRILCENTSFGEYSIAKPEEMAKAVEQLLRSEFGEDFTPGTLTEAVYDSIGRIRNGLPVNDPVAGKIYPGFCDWMRKNKKADFDDMMLRFYDLLTDDPKLLKKLQDRYRFILLDEFQDINRTQYEIIRLLSGDRQNVFAVGDDDQSIYGFRGSDPGYMKRFLKDFRHPEKILLPVNHRSTASIVRASGNLIRKNRGRFQKKLCSRQGKGPEPVRMEFENALQEADYIVHMIRVYRNAASDAGLREPDVAILGRTRHVLKEMEDILNEQIGNMAGETIKLLTFHGAKGLEFDVVFLIGANEGITPGARGMQGEALEEERRCFYVAMTRARKYLHILYTKSCYNKPVERSRFVKETVSFW